MDLFRGVLELAISKHIKKNNDSNIFINDTNLKIYPIMNSDFDDKVWILNNTIEIAYEVSESNEWYVYVEYYISDVK